MTKKLEERIREVINRHDPIGLIAYGCPSDEYDPEIQKIIPKIKIAKSVLELHDSVYSIFCEMFNKNIAGNRREYRELSEELYSLKRN